MDAFYASVEERDHPELKGKPVIIGAKPGGRGVVSTANYLARTFGVHSAQPINEAYRRCPQGIFLPPSMPKYLEASRIIMEVFRSFTPLVEPLSVDEAFLDIRGLQKLWGSPQQLAQLIQNKIAKKTQLTCSIGIGINKFLAKLASSNFKPNRITVTPLSEQQIIEWLAPMPISRLWGIGKKSEEKLYQKQIYTLGDLQSKSLHSLESAFGNQGRTMHQLCRGIDFREIQLERTTKSISREHTFARDNANKSTWQKVLLNLSRSVAENARKSGLAGDTIYFTFRTSDFKRRSRRKKISAPTDLTQVIYKTVLELLSENIFEPIPLRLIGVGLSGFTSSRQENMIFIQPKEKDLWKDSENAMDRISQKFGKGTIFYGGEMKHEGRSSILNRSS